MGYHQRKITKGTYGEFSKIREEFEELEDAVDQGNPILVLCELSDLLGAIEGYLDKRYGESIGMVDLALFSQMTQEAFKAGERGFNREEFINAIGDAGVGGIGFQETPTPEDIARVVLDAYEAIGNR